MIVFTAAEVTQLVILAITIVLPYLCKIIYDHHKKRL